ncbi:hypothetical protein ACFV20_19325 [Streptomyces sp. NPDC059696]|uniref:hypothetical protein n=1 Tax=Streptomyces sp. NPDC059696 TaxID=3346911 RepID=UPI0036805ED8
MFAAFKARQRHNKLMRAAHHLLREAFISANREPAHVTAAHLAAYTFGQYRIELDHEEAQRFLDAARIARGEPTPDQPYA